MKSKNKATSTDFNENSLTIEKLKSFKGFENITDEEAIEIVFALQTFANILHDLMSSKSEDNQFKRAA